MVIDRACRDRGIAYQGNIDYTGVVTYSPPLVATTITWKMSK